MKRDVPTVEVDFGISRLSWYTLSMGIDFGNGPALKDSSPWLRDDAERHRRILDVVERDSVIEGLPPFQEETRRRILEQLQATGARPPAPAE